MKERPTCSEWFIEMLKLEKKLLEDEVQELKEKVYRNWGEI